MYTKEIETLNKENPIKYKNRKTKNYNLTKGLTHFQQNKSNEIEWNPSRVKRTESLKKGSHQKLSVL